MQTNDIHNDSGEPHTSEPAVSAKTLQDLHAIVKQQHTENAPERAYSTGDTVTFPREDGSTSEGQIIGQFEYEGIKYLRVGNDKVLKDVKKTDLDKTMAESESQQSPRLKSTFKKTTEPQTPAEPTTPEQNVELPDEAEISIVKPESEVQAPAIYTEAVDSARNFTIDTLTIMADKIGEQRHFSQELYEAGLKVMNDFNRITEKYFLQHPRQCDRVAELVEERKDELRRLTVGKNEHGGTIDRDIDSAKDALLLSRQQLHYDFMQLRDAGGDERAQDRLYRDIKRQYDTSTNEAMQCWSQLPKRFGEANTIAIVTVDDMVRFMRTATDTEDTYDYHKELIQAAEDYRVKVERYSGELRQELLMLNTRAIDASREISDTIVTTISKGEL
ncbi:hypothetical protein H0W80_04785 [Candidatus Saccharibacteria bacterium]|nr:hypothetical protein [Candidatus Saccharibacteria bacterium]